MDLSLKTKFYIKADQEDRTKDAVLNLLLRCLSYDFAGTSLDEAGEDSNVVQVKKKLIIVGKDIKYIKLL